MLKCSKCKIEKDDSCFYIANNTKRKKQSQCKDCVKIGAIKHYYKYKEEQKQRATFKTKLYRFVIQSIKESYGCFNCQCKNHICLDFHHLDPKEKDFNIAAITKSKSKLIVDEINKCVVACANCHRMIHAGQIQVNMLAKVSISQLYFNDLLEINKANFGFNNKIIRARKNKVYHNIKCQCGNKKLKDSNLCADCYNKNRQSKISWPTNKELMIMLENTSFLSIAKKLGVSDNAIRKRLKKNIE